MTSELGTWINIAKQRTKELDEARAMLAMVRKVLRDESPLEDFAAMERALIEYFERLEEV